MGNVAFDKILQIKLWTSTLRELLLLQSMYLCGTQTEILELVKEQPNPSVFYKTFFEIDKANLLNILSFDSRSIKALLNDNFSEYY